MKSLLILLIASLFSPVVFAADATQDAPVPKTPPKDKGKLVASEFCPYGTVGSPVGISVDDQGRVFVTETDRRTMGEVDIRTHWEMLVGSLALKSVDDKRAFLHANYHKGEVGDANHDGVQDWKDLLMTTEKIFLLIDSDGDGKFDKKQLFVENFNTEITGVGAGVLAFGPNVYFTAQPDLWKLTDTTGAGIANQRVSLSHGHGIHVGMGGHDMHGPAMGPDGRIYWSQGDKGYNLTSKEGRNFAEQYQGAVFRVDPDGSNLEVFAHGLRNPQEIAFDDFGNLFTVDNDADIGDRERFVYITEGSDSGWRVTYQYRNRKIPGVTDGGYNPWMAEDLWKPRFDTQASYLTPGIANYSDGPCGFKFNPGTALSEEYQGHFFLTHFPKKLLTTFKAQPDGASFKMVNERVAFSGLMMTGICFGPDGAIYSADWGENAWAPHQKGRVVKIDVPGTTPHSALRVETQHLLAEGMSKRPLDEVAAFLSHADQRIRLRAQFELVARGAQGAAALLKSAEKNDSLLARVHAIWGLGQLARQTEGAGEGRSAIVKALSSLLSDPDLEIRAQSAKVLGDATIPSAADGVVALLKDREPRVRLLAGVALSKMARPTDFDAIVALLDGNKTKDVYLRHAGVVALVGACGKDPAPLAGLATHPNRQVRLAAIVALRRLHSPLVEKFLDDKDEWVLAEAARAIHDDTSIPQSLPALASLLQQVGERKLTNEPLLRRAINANLRVGDADSARRLVAFASGLAPANLRANAIDALAWFANPPKLDRVEGRYRELPVRDEAIAHAALDPAITRLLNDISPAVRNSTVNAIQQLHFDAARDRLAKIALDPAQPTSVRAPALIAISALKSPQTRQAVELAIKSTDAKLRAAALTVMAQLDPNGPATLAALKSTLNIQLTTDNGQLTTNNSVLEQQAALAALGNLKSAQAASLLSAWADRLVAGQVPAPLQLDVIEAAEIFKDKTLPDKLKAYTNSKPKGGLSPHIESLEGGDAIEGEIIFKSGQCTQCHMVNNLGGAVGPDLSHVAARLARKELLESIVLPNAKIAEGFATISVTTKDGDTLTGTLQSETAAELTLKDPETNQLIKIKKTDVESKTAPTSAMPPMAEVLSPREIRHVVEYLTTLK